MRTSYQIYCDYIQAVAKASMLDNIADRLERTSRKIVEEKDVLKASWQGNPMQVVEAKSYEINDEIRVQVSKLRHIANVARTIARRNYNTEMRALEIARNRENSAAGFGGGGGGGGAR